MASSIHSRIQLFYLRKKWPQRGLATFQATNPGCTACSEVRCTLTFPTVCSWVTQVSIYSIHMCAHMCAVPHLVTFTCYCACISAQHLLPTHNTCLTVLVPWSWSYSLWWAARECWELNSCPLKEQQLFLSSPSIWPPHLIIVHFPHDNDFY